MRSLKIDFLTDFEAKVVLLGRGHATPHPSAVPRVLDDIKKDLQKYKV